MSDVASSERDRAYLRLMEALGAEYAHRWLTALNRTIDAIPEPFGPRAHAPDEEASARYGAEIRRALYHGPGPRRAKIPYRILFLVIDPVPGESEGAVRVLRILHGSQSPEGSADTGATEG